MASKKLIVSFWCETTNLAPTSPSAPLAALLESPIEVYTNRPIIQNCPTDVLYRILSVFPCVVSAKKRNPNQNKVLIHSISRAEVPILSRSNCFTAPVCQQSSGQRIFQPANHKRPCVAQTKQTQGPLRMGGGGGGHTKQSRTRKGFCCSCRGPWWFSSTPQCVKKLHISAPQWCRTTGSQHTQWLTCEAHAQTLPVTLKTCGLCMLTAAVDPVNTNIRISSFTCDSPVSTYWLN